MLMPLFPVGKNLTKTGQITWNLVAQDTENSWKLIKFYFFIYYILCLMYYVLCIMYYVLCLMSYVLCLISTSVQIDL